VTTIYLILDNLSANKTPTIRAWATRHKVELCFTPTNASWANPIPVNRPSEERLARVG
jgi:DDE superfamily endonuclease